MLFLSFCWMGLEHAMDPLLGLKARESTKNQFSAIEHTWYQVRRLFLPKYLSQQRYLVAKGALFG
jgi:hypothetical protein